MQAVGLLEKKIQRALTELDHNLFLDKEFSRLGGYVYYVVKYRMEDGVEPLKIVDWRHGNYPRGLSFDIVDQVRSQESDIRETAKQAAVNNAARKELARQEREEAQEELAREFHKSTGRRL